MDYILSNAKIIDGDVTCTADVFVKDGIIADISPSFPKLPGVSVVELNECFLFPGFSDVHVHLREPGFSYKETIASGTAAAARGGFTSVCSMPNLSPVPDSPENLRPELDAIQRDACIHVYPYGAITRGQAGHELSDMAALAPLTAAFSDDGKGVQSDELMEAAMRTAKACGRLIAAHCEDNSLLNGGYIHDGEYAAAHGHSGISSESEWRQIERDIELVRRTGCAYHVCHVSTKESIALIRRAKSEGLDVTCETAPHYLILSDDMLEEDGRFKMNPPLRSAADRSALIEAVRDGTVDMIATDHAPHSAEEKSRGLKDSSMGIVGLETAFPLLYTYLVKPGTISLKRLLELMHGAALRRFGIGSELKKGSAADLTIFDVNEKYIIDPEEFLSMGRATPFKGWEVFGKCMMTMVNGRIVYDAKRI